MGTGAAGRERLVRKHSYLLTTTRGINGIFRVAKPRNLEKRKCRAPRAKPPLVPTAWDLSRAINVMPTTPPEQNPGEGGGSGE